MDWCRGEGKFPLPAYSEFMPPPWLGLKPFDGGPAPGWQNGGDGWSISEYEQIDELRPGFRVLAAHIVRELARLGRGLPTHELSHRILHRNPAWPDELRETAGRLTHERFVTITSLALSRTQDDKGRVRWTLFGASELGPAYAFWRGLARKARGKRGAAAAREFFAALLVAAYGEGEDRDPAALGFRIFEPASRGPRSRERVPPACRAWTWDGAGSLRKVRYVLTFRPFAELPKRLRAAYLAGGIHLLPFPGNLAFWGSEFYCRLAESLPLAAQIPLLQLFPQFNDPEGIRIPPMGWLDESEDRRAPAARILRSHRWQRIERDQDETKAFTADDPVTAALFSTEPRDLGLYTKPMARNCQLWTEQAAMVLDGTRAGREELARARGIVDGGGRFGYRLHYPAMRVGPMELYWHYPLIAWPKRGAPDEAAVFAAGPQGVICAYDAAAPRLEHRLELWPELEDDSQRRASAELFEHQRSPRRKHDAWNTRCVLHFADATSLAPLPRSLARDCIHARKESTLEDWLSLLPGKALDAPRAEALVRHLRSRIAATADEDLGEALTLDATAARPFETAYWRAIASLAHGVFSTKSNADVVQDAATRKALRRSTRDLDRLADYLIERHRGSIARSKLGRRAWAGEQRFRWRTDFDFPWMGGWMRNQTGELHERNVFVRIPGRDPSQAVILADHYDTAFMEDVYGREPDGGPRVAARGADDNHSATALLLLAAPILLGLSRAGKLARDVWLVHLTGEEFPADCMGARALCQALVERSLRVAGASGKEHDLSGVEVAGVYVADMIAHNHDRDRYVFQIAPGETRRCAWLATQAQAATELWNRLASERNRRAPRRSAAPYAREEDPKRVPAVAKHARLDAEIRCEWDPRSSLFNTDGQIFSDAGVPVVLFMENYDIRRRGYHDSLDTLANVDLDYGAALAAVIIETVARAAAAPCF
jgi:hypothetical protein